MSSLSEITLRYLKDQTLDSFMELRRQIAATHNYAPYANWEATVYPLLQQEKYQEAIDSLRSMLPGWLLSPGLHSLLAYAHDKLGNAEESQKEAFLAQVTATGILKTGDGSETRPYLVMQISDEYDILRCLGKKSSAQTLVRKDDRSFDKHTCEDGSEVWFDITIPLSRLQTSRA